MPDAVLGIPMYVIITAGSVLVTALCVWGIHRELHR